MNSGQRWRILILGSALLVFTAFAKAQAGSGEFEWRFTIKPNQVASSNITADNICRNRHRFEIDSAHLPAFVHLANESGADVEAHTKHAFPVTFDSSGLAAGEHQGLVLINCMDCKRENGCTQDRQTLHIYMTVAAAEVPSAPRQGSKPHEMFVPDRVLVLVPLDSPGGVDAAAKKLATGFAMNVVEVHPLASLNAALVTYSLPPGSDVQAKVGALAKDVLLAQPDFLYRTAGTATDSMAQLQYGRRLIHADQVVAPINGKGVKVAIIDTGIDAGHPAISGKVVEQMDFTGKGFTPDVHGTLLAGIIAGEQKDSSSISGVSPGVQILGIKACQPMAQSSAEAQCWSSTLAKALDYAIQEKARVMNLSLGGPSDKLLTRLIDAAIKHQAVVVAAAGNDGPHGPASYPAALPNVVSVTAVDANEQLYADATEGDFIQVAAPGVEIVSTSPGGKLMVSSGTSMATAFVSGTAALLIQQNPPLSPVALQSLLQRTAKHLGPQGKSPKFGSGLIDVCQALTELNRGRKLCR